ncbi:MAG TPA: reductive dehalogenase domain-containing protein [Syntrophorhabdales bacterium]|nr:reductive dehalogenase domain-containing protein [Syntrophorhabdales bacterium]
MKLVTEALPRIEDFVKHPTFSTPGPITRFKQTDQVFMRVGRGEVEVDYDEIGVTSPPPHPLDRTVFSPSMLRAHLWKACEPKPLSWKASITDTKKMSAHIKETAKYLGADLVGITHVYEAFAFANDRNEEPLDLSPYKYAIVMAREMDYDRVRTTPSWYAHVEDGQTYQECAILAIQLAIYIAQLGYAARASCAGNDVVMHVPHAIYAGLGELSRIGIMITKEYGPRVRLCTVVTDLPLEVDHPVDLNVGHFCEACKKCVTNCPSGAIAAKGRTEVRGVLKWKANDVGCYRYWRKDPMNWQACIRCVSVCPWSKPRTAFHQTVANIAANYPSSHRLINFFDDVFYGRKPKQKSIPSGFNDYRMSQEDFMKMVHDTALNVRMLNPEKK